MPAADRDALVARYRLPEPRVGLGPRLLGIASAALDVSDGLMADLAHIAEVSHVRIIVDAARVPLSPALKKFWGTDLKAIAHAATAGDDYEIAFTAPVSARDAIRSAAREANVNVHEIGRVEEGQGATLVDGAGKSVPLGRLGFTHF